MSLTDVKKEIRKYFGMTKNKKSFYMDIVVLTLIIITSITYILETYNVPTEILTVMKIIDTLILSLFTIEYFVRLWVTKSKKRFFKNPYMWIDLIVILPFIFGIANLQFLRILRLFRIIRYSEKYLNWDSTQEQKRLDRLYLLRIVFAIFAVLFISSGLFYIVETGHNANVNDFDDAFYFVVITVTTVGFGDITPVTDLGKLTTIIVILSGIIFIPYNIGLLLKYSIIHNRKTSVTCPQCGLKHHEQDAVFCKSCGHQIYQEHDGEPALIV